MQTENSRIIVLPPELADQIAAGEVVERPASVVKELVENALDAGARRIDVEIEGGGLELIRITDDGCGMTPAEAHLSLLRHATSKLRRIEDLFGLSTMGFRGEALPSIAAVSKLTLTTRVKGAVAAYRLAVHGGREQGPGREVGAPIGTQLEVRDLLKNVPARLKFMKTAVTESGQVQEALLRLALAHPEVHLRLRSGDKQVLDLPPHRSGLERAQAALGGRGAGAGLTLYRAQGAESGITVEVYLGAPSNSTSTPRNVYLFVNRRFIRDRSLLHAVVMGYGELLERGRYPLSVVNIDVPGEGVDINVHPQKLEVRFARPQEVYAAVRHVMQATTSGAPWLTAGFGGGRDAIYGGRDDAEERGRDDDERLSRDDAEERGRDDAEDGARRGAPSDLFAAEDRPGYGARGPEPRGSDPRDLDPRDPAPPGAWNPATHPVIRVGAMPGGGGDAGLAEHRARLQQALDLYAPSPRVAAPAGAAAAGASATGAATTDGAASAVALSQPEPSAAPAVHRFFGNMTYLGQLRRTYLLCEHEGELVMIDQHAAHERLAFERLRAAHGARAVRTQRLLFPLSLDVDAVRAAALLEHGELLTTLGFEIRPFSGNSFALLAVPDAAVFGRGARVHQDPEKLLLRVVDDLLEDGSTAALTARVEAVLATIACHSVVRAGDALDPARAQALLQSMDEVPYVPHCPHGRPVLVRVAPSEIERRFGRA